MKEIKCPKCGEVFSVDESGYAEILSQIKNKEFEEELKKREESFVARYDAESKLKLNKTLSIKEQEIEKLKNNLKLSELSVKNTISDAINSKDIEIEKLKNQIEINENKAALSEKNLEQKYNSIIKDKDEQIKFYRDFKTKLSTKLVGETLEQHCMIQFNQLRTTVFPNAYFEKDNKISNETSSKGDFIFKDTIDGVEYISIMFEMKNENDTTATKHKMKTSLKNLIRTEMKRSVNMQF